MNIKNIKELTKHALEYNTARTIFNIEKEIENRAANGYWVLVYKCNVAVDSQAIIDYFDNKGFDSYRDYEFFTIKWG